MFFHQVSVPSSAWLALQNQRFDLALAFVRAVLLVHFNKRQALSDLFPKPFLVVSV
jgi:hypothetical protein